MIAVRGILLIGVRDILLIGVRGILLIGVRGILLIGVWLPKGTQRGVCQAVAPPHEI